MLETTRVKRNGYVFRQLYTTFLQRYKMLSPLTWPHGAGIAIDGVSRLLRDLPISATEYAFGRTKIFIKNIGTVSQRPRPFNTFINYIELFVSIDRLLNKD